MFDFLKKEFKILSPADGKVVSLSKVPDQIFSNRIAGDGVAIQPIGNKILSPADGVVSFIFNTNHAFGIILDNGLEVLVHIGIDTIDLQGQGFQRVVSEGSKIKAGDIIIKIDEKFIQSKGYSLITPVIITNMDVICDINFKCNLNSCVKAGKDPIITYRMR
ncbi:PTS glucose transporter subunit IIA [Clostridium tyrobutyricum]|uniref:PTS sugar transporter subunit IIA n=1 Tax=Clostridium tyrobutyricum TaxID=1519 RepID=UPI001C3846D5|nr:PTS glucose transporter subunit IIA [Clostridium tyrobutyricum]MBV4417998.1 PTS glucose transporter subunit IIA [Clostridium tyrobutyricum]